MHSYWVQDHIKQKQMISFGSKEKATRQITLPSIIRHGHKSQISQLTLRSHSVRVCVTLTTVPPYRSSCIVVLLWQHNIHADDVISNPTDIWHMSLISGTFISGTCFIVVGIRQTSELIHQIHIHIIIISSILTISILSW